MKTLVEKINEKLITEPNLGHAQSVVNLIVIEDEIFFIKRSETMPSHKGDIAFIGGHIKKDEDIYTASLREFEEETGLSPDSLRSLGVVKTQMPVAVLAYELKIGKKEFLESIKTNGEWTDAFFVKVKTLSNLDNWSFGEYFLGENKRKIYFCNLHYKKYVVWGMTAHIVYWIVNK